MPRRIWLIPAVALAIGCADNANAAILDLSTDGSLELPRFPVPSPFAGGVDDFAMTLWLRRETAVDGTVSSVLDGDAGVFTITIDDAADVIDFSYVGSAGTIQTSLALRDGRGAVPTGEWMLLACSWDSTGQSLTTFAQSESVGLVASSASDATSDFGPPWPWILGSANTVPAVVGQYGLVGLRSHQVTLADFNLLWNGGAPRYFAPLTMTAGSFNGVDGMSYMVGHGVSTVVNTITNLAAEPAELGDALNVNNVLSYVDFGLVDYFTAGQLLSVSGEWTFRSPHEADAAHAGFFVREAADVGLGAQPWVERVSPRAKQLADGRADGLVRVIASANSRAVRVAFSYDVGWENYAYGGLYRSRKSEVAGVTIPAWNRLTTPWPGFFGTGRFAGVTEVTNETTSPSVCFGNFGSHGAVNINYPSYLLGGNALVAVDGSTFVPKARPEPGTLFASATDPLTVRVMLLSFPGAGMVTYEGEKATTQAAVGTLAGGATSIALDTTVHTHALTASDVLDSTTRTITLQGIVSGIESGDGCFVASGAGGGGISMVTDVDVSSGVSTVITLERWFAVSPAVESSVLAFGPVSPVWVEHAWGGLDPGDPEVYRGIRVEPSDGIAVALFFECFRPGVDGIVIGGVGKSGTGYDLQVNQLFTSGGVPMFEGLAADVWLQFFAHQGSQATGMAGYAQLLKASSPATEIWWCGDPDFDTLSSDVEGTDSWHSYILDNAEANGVGALSAHEHAWVGTGLERGADGQVSGAAHLSARGNEILMAATLDVLGSAALPGVSPCAADCAGGGDGVVDVVDLLELLGLWGGPGGCDVTGSGGRPDGVVDVVDLLLILSSWGRCELAGV